MRMGWGEEGAWAGHSQTGKMSKRRGEGATSLAIQDTHVKQTSPSDGTGQSPTVAGVGLESGDGPRAASGGEKPQRLLEGGLAAPGEGAEKPGPSDLQPSSRNSP